MKQINNINKKTLINLLQSNDIIKQITEIANLSCMPCRESMNNKIEKLKEDSLDYQKETLHNLQELHKNILDQSLSRTKILIIFATFGSFIGGILQTGINKIIPYFTSYLS